MVAHVTVTPFITWLLENWKRGGGGAGGDGDGGGETGAQLHDDIGAPKSLRPEEEEQSQLPDGQSDPWVHDADCVRLRSCLDPFAFVVWDRGATA